MRSLKIIVLTADPERLRGALAAAAAHVALGGEANIFFQMDAAALLSSTPAPRDAAHVAAGMPTLTALIEEAMSLGVTLTACQSGLAISAIDATSLDPRIAISGTVAFLQGVSDEDRLLFV